MPAGKPSARPRVATVLRSAAVAWPPSARRHKAFDEVFSHRTMAARGTG
jgi:hypothetical protein